MSQTEQGLIYLLEVPDINRVVIINYIISHAKKPRQRRRHRAVEEQYMTQAQLARLTPDALQDVFCEHWMLERTGTVGELHALAGEQVLGYGKATPRSTSKQNRLFCLPSPRPLINRFSAAEVVGNYAVL
eukprot:m.224684 g.224684  ORF g.224684 m.224684 type:complete len:130 (+) comp17034_c3_seq2:302-691(+)